MSLLSEGVVYIVATPIGNLSDITYRAVDVLHSVDLILCEDTRQTQILLQHYGIKKPLESYHQHSEVYKIDRIIEGVSSGKKIALVSDAGTPLISDPGFLLVRALREKNIPVIPLPGPSAAIAALSVSGLPTHTFYFAGFLSPKSGARRDALQALQYRTETLILYEAPHRILETLEDIADIFRQRLCVLAKELTKRFEQVKAASASQLIVWLTEDPVRQKGEFVLMIEGQSPDVSILPETSLIRTEKILRALSELTSIPSAAKIAAHLTGFSKNQLYQALLEIKESKVLESDTKPQSEI